MCYAVFPLATVLLMKILTHLWHQTIQVYFILPQVTPPPVAGAVKIRPSKPTAFRKFYDRGDFPIALEHDTKGNKIAWKVKK